MTVRLEEESPPDEMYGPEEDPACNEEDSPPPRLGTAKVKWVLPSKKSTRQDGRGYLEPSPD